MSKVSKSPPFVTFYSQISEDAMYEDDSESVEEVLNDMRTKPFKSLKSHSRGSQFKFVVEFEGGGKAMLKPMRFPRNLTVINSLNVT